MTTVLGLALGTAIGHALGDAFDDQVLEIFDGGEPSQNPEGELDLGAHDQIGGVMLDLGGA